MSGFGKKYYHPFLFPAYFVLFIFCRNLGEVGISDILLPFAFVFSTSILLYGCFFYYYKNHDATAVLTSVVQLCFYLYGSMITVFSQYFPFSPAYPLFFIFSMLITFLIIIAKEHTVMLRQLSEALNIVAILLVAYNLIPPVSFYASIVLQGRSDAMVHPKEGQLLDRPDIYYIIPDAYPRNDNLLRVFNYDNTPFLNKLKERGFYVANESMSNYASTYLSLASSMNLEYINYLSDAQGRSLSNAYNTYRRDELVQNNMLARYLSDRGYVFVNFRSGGGPTDSMDAADIQRGYFSYRTNNEFFFVFLDSTLLSPFIREWLVTNQRKDVLYTLDNLGSVAKMPEPTFTLAHFIAPHPPFLFDRKGNLPELSDRYANELFVDQLIYVNERLLGSIDEILSNSKRPPVIIIQGDHGTGLSTFFNSCTDERGPYGLSEAQIAERMKILNAYYLPGIEEGELYPSISPVNTFRLVLNNYFGENFTILDDQSYFSCWNMDPLNFRKVQVERDSLAYPNRTIIISAISPQADAGM